MKARASRRNRSSSSKKARKQTLFFLSPNSDQTFFKPTPTHATAYGKMAAEKPLPQNDQEITLSAAGSSSRPKTVSVHGSGQSIDLEGKTDAEFNASFKTKNIKAKQAEGCEECEKEECFKFTGTLVSTFKVETTVTLPSASDFSDLTKCQQQAVKSAIKNKLAPHEQEHVKRFKKYNGTVKTPINLTFCKSEFDSRMQEMHDNLDLQRQDDALKQSEQLDQPPFFVPVDLDCTDKPVKKK